MQCRNAPPSLRTSAGRGFVSITSSDIVAECPPSQFTGPVLEVTGQQILCYSAGLVTGERRFDQRSCSGVCVVDEGLLRIIHPTSALVAFTALFFFVAVLSTFLNRAISKLPKIEDT